MNEELESEDEKLEKAKRKLKISLRWFFRSIWELGRDTLSVRKGADMEGTVESIKRDAEFSGHNVWILILSILIASIGLNTNSVAIIIGAMLISPLMGPILGIGYGAGTNDIDTLALSLKNLLVAVVVAIFTSYLYFKLTPFTDDQPEILARTKPHLLDVLISIFGGLAGIIGNSRRERGNVIPGVAIATALMPPLCTAGYGLAMGNWEYFLGAFYLFMLNAAGIGVTTLVVVKYMRFPMVHFIDLKTNQRVKWLVGVFWFLLIVPSGFMFYHVLEEELFKRKVKEFVATEIKFDETYLVKFSQNYRRDSISQIDLFFYGKVLDSTIEANLTSKLSSHELLSTTLNIYQDSHNSEEFQRSLKEVKSSYTYLFDEANSAIEIQNAKIAALQHTMESLEVKDSIAPLLIWNKESHIVFPEIEQLAYAEMEYIRGDSVVKIPTFYVKKKKRVWVDEPKMMEWLKMKSGCDTVRVIIN